MLRVSRVLFLFFLLTAPSAKAALIERTYTEMALYYDGLIGEVADLHDLSSEDAYEIRMSALAWILGGTCEEPLSERDSKRVSGALSLFMFPSDSSFEIALHHTIGALMAKSIGRKPNASLCKFARESLAN